MGFWREHMPAGMFLRSGPDWHLDASVSTPSRPTSPSAHRARRRRPDPDLGLPRLRRLVHRAEGAGDVAAAQLQEPDRRGRAGRASQSADACRASARLSPLLPSASDQPANAHRRPRRACPSRLLQPGRGCGDLARRCLRPSACRRHVDGQPARRPPVRPAVSVGRRTTPTTRSACGPARGCLLARRRATRAAHAEPEDVGLRRRPGAASRPTTSDGQVRAAERPVDVVGPRRAPWKSAAMTWRSAARPGSSVAELQVDVEQPAVQQEQRSTHRSRGSRSTSAGRRPGRSRSRRCGFCAAPPPADRRVAPSDLLARLPARRRTTGRSA